MSFVPYPSPTLQPSQRWRVDLCSCCDDCTTCYMSLVCPCVVYANIAQRLDGSSWCGACTLYSLCFLLGCQCLLHASKRTTLRHQYDLQADCCCDCCTVWCCGCCALAQESRELKLRGPPPRQFMQPLPLVIGAAGPLYAQPMFIVGTSGSQVVPMQAPLQQPQYAGYAAPPQQFAAQVAECSPAHTKQSPPIPDHGTVYEGGSAAAVDDMPPPYSSS